MCERSLPLKKKAGAKEITPRALLKGSVKRQNRATQRALAPLAQTWGLSLRHDRQGNTHFTTI